MSKQRYVFLQDESSHWYIVPLEKTKRFNELLYPKDTDYDEACDLFMEEFSGCMAQGHVSGYSFTDPEWY